MVSLRQFQRYVNGFYPKSDVEVMAFQSFWYQFSDKHKHVHICMCPVGTGFAGKPLQRNTIGKVSLRRFQLICEWFLSEFGCRRYDISNILV